MQITVLVAWLCGRCFESLDEKGREDITALRDENKKKSGTLIISVKELLDVLRFEQDFKAKNADSPHTKYKGKAKRNSC